jgi:hypothetical protein
MCARALCGQHYGPARAANVLAVQINLQYLQNRLEEVCQDHSKSCAQVPGFVLQERFNIKALYLACQDCGTFQIVI